MISDFQLPIHGDLGLDIRLVCVYKQGVSICHRISVPLFMYGPMSCMHPCCMSCRPMHSVRTRPTRSHTRKDRARTKAPYGILAPYARAIMNIVIQWIDLIRSLPDCFAIGLILITRHTDHHGRVTRSNSISSLSTTRTILAMNALTQLKTTLSGDDGQVIIGEQRYRLVLIVHRILEPLRRFCNRSCCCDKKGHNYSQAFRTRLWRRERTTKDALILC